MENSEDLVERLRKRAEIRRSIPTRKSVQQGEPDRISELLEEAAHVIEDYKNGFDLLCVMYEELMSFKQKEFRNEYL